MSSAPKRIFIVEDQRLIAADIESTLAKLGYEVAGSAASGEQAIERIVAADPDLVLMEIRLRGAMDGIEAAAAVRQHRSVPIVYLTAYADEETVRRAKLTSPFGYVIKPFHERELRAAIEISLYKHETDRLLLEERARREAAEEFRLMVESVEEYAIYRLDPEGRVSTWNLGAERIFGHRAEEVVGQNVALLCDASDSEAVRPELALEAARLQGSFELERFRLRRDGSRFWAHVVTTALRDDHDTLLGFAELTRDLSDRKREEDIRSFLDRVTVSLTSSIDYPETLERAARAAAPELADMCLLRVESEKGVWDSAAASADPETGELVRALAVPAAPSTDVRGLSLAPGERTRRSRVHGPLDDAASGARLLGSERADIVRALGLGFRPFSADDRAGRRFSGRFAGRRKGSPPFKERGTARKAPDKRGPPKKGETRVGVRFCLALPLDVGGRATGVLFLLRTAGSGPYAERDRAAAEQLAYRIGMALDNARLLHETQQAIRVRDEFLQIASHELRTPLTPLQLQLDMLAQAVEGIAPCDERLTHRLESAARQTRRLVRLIEMVLDVSRLTSGRYALEIEDFDLAAMLREVVARFEPEARRAHCSIHLDAPAALVGAWDRARLETVVINLLSNAVKYGAGKPVDLSLLEADAEVHLSVRDRGIGIAEDAVERIFGRFERAVSVRHFGGLGLGLFVARQVVEAHGGSIAVRSRPGEGATFTVTLPLRTAIPAASRWLRSATR